MKFFHPIYYIPKNWLSYWIGWTVSRPWPLGLHHLIRDTFIRAYKVNTAEAEYPVDQYSTLGDFFVRRLKLGERPLGEGLVISPVDGKVTQGGMYSTTQKELLFQQIKGKTYTFSKLIPNISSQTYIGGGYNTIYLAPYNYHRVHAPISGNVTRVIYVPGALWPVNSWSVQNIDGLFSVNERLIVELTSKEGSMLVVLVGATNVGKMTLDFYNGIVGNSKLLKVIKEWVPSEKIFLKKGDPLGCFEMGSTVILIGSASLIDSFQRESNEMGNTMKNMQREIKVGEPISFDKI